MLHGNHFCGQLQIIGDIHLNIVGCYLVNVIDRYPTPPGQFVFFNKVQTSLCGPSTLRYYHIKIKLSVT